MPHDLSHQKDFGEHLIGDVCENSGSKPDDQKILQINKNQSALINDGTKAVEFQKSDSRLLDNREVEVEG